MLQAENAQLLANLPVFDHALLREIAAEKKRRNQEKKKALSASHDACG